MHKINFTKMVASGNDFVVVQFSGLPIFMLRKLAQKICDRKFGAGADGLLLLGKSKIADIRMRIFNADGSEAKMCGNGARCVAFWEKSKVSPLTSGIPSKTGKSQKSKIVKIETKAGVIESKVNGENVKIKLTEPKDFKLNLPIKVNNRMLRVNFLNTGVPHTVIFVEGLDKIDVFNIGRKIRYHKRFAPYGTNVDFVEVLRGNHIKIRTYERGVEDETLACGTGAVASSIISNIKYQISNIKEHYRINIETKSGEILKVYFKKTDGSFKDVWLEGKAKIVYKGVYYVK